MSLLRNSENFWIIMLYLTIDEATWIPILTFISRDNEEKYIFRLQAEEIRDFLDGGLPPKISNMLSELMIDMRNSKIDKLI